METKEKKAVLPLIDHTEGNLSAILIIARNIKDPSFIGCIQRLRKRWNSKGHVLNIWNDYRGTDFYFEIVDTATEHRVLNGGIIYHGSHDLFGTAGVADHVCLTPTKGWSTHT